MSYQSEPQSEHRWLQQFVGEWTYETQCAAGPREPTQILSGTETVRSVGGLWILGEGAGQMPDGGPSTSIITIGFDSKSKRFVGTWIGSMMDHLWVSDGWLDDSGKVLTLESDGPSFTDSGKLSKYRDVFEFKSDDHRVLTASVLGDDGSWTTFMTSHYRRK